MLEISKYLKLSYARGLPQIAVIEPTNNCIFSCPMCPLGQNRILRKRGYMSYENFKKVIDSFKDNLKVVILFNFGEPFLNNNIFKMIKYCKKKKIFTITSTNAGILNKSLINNIINSGLDYLTISLNGASEKTYRIYNTAKNFKKAINNIEKLCKKKRMKYNLPFVDLQFIVMRENEGEISKIKELAKRLGVDMLSIKTAWIFDEKVKNILPRNTIYRRYYLKYNVIKSKNKTKNWCPWPWSATVVFWDGSVHPCCYDLNGKYNFGNIFDRSLESIWNDKKYIKFRKQILTNKNDIPMCAQCTLSTDVFVERIYFNTNPYILKKMSKYQIKA
jgi:radical SAM protein with 4Fe4S-binding SPASM domain